MPDDVPVSADPTGPRRATEPDRTGRATESDRTGRDRTGRDRDRPPPAAPGPPCG